MKSVRRNVTRVISFVLLVGVVSLAGCSNKSATDKTATDKNSEPTPVSTTSDAKSGSKQVATQSQPSGATETTTPAAPAEMALVVQNYGMAKFSTLNRFYDLGYTLFSIYQDGAVSSGSSANLTNYQIDWKTAKVKRYGATDISLLTPRIKNLNTGQSVTQQQITLSRAVENKLTLATPDSFSATLTIETLVSDSARTICVLGISTP